MDENEKWPELQLAGLYGMGQKKTGRTILKV